MVNWCSLQPSCWRARLQYAPVDKQEQYGLCGVQAGHDLYMAVSRDVSLRTLVMLLCIPGDVTHSGTICT